MIASGGGGGGRTPRSLLNISEAAGSFPPPVEDPRKNVRVSTWAGPTYRYTPGGRGGEEDGLPPPCTWAAITHVHAAGSLPGTLARFPNASPSPVSKCYLSVGRGSSVAVLITEGGGGGVPAPPRETEVRKHRHLRLPDITPLPPP